MKSLFYSWLKIRLFTVIALTGRFVLAYCIARHWNVPIQEALMGVLLFTSCWTDTKLYFHVSGSLPAPKENSSHDTPIRKPSPSFLSSQARFQQQAHEG
jgi:hypothetical protein